MNHLGQLKMCVDLVWPLITVIDHSCLILRFPQLSVEKLPSEPMGVAAFGRLETFDDPQDKELPCR